MQGSTLSAFPAGTRPVLLGLCLRNCKNIVLSTPELIWSVDPMRLATTVALSSLAALTACAPQIYPPYSGTLTSRSTSSSYTSSSYTDPMVALRNSTANEAQQEAEAARNAVKSGTLSPYTVAVAENAVRETLRDPESARFRNVKRNAMTGAVCGLLNAKNAYGGYVGESPFIYYYSEKYKSPQLLSGNKIAQTGTLPYIAAFCPSDSTSISGDRPNGNLRRS